MKHVIYSEKSLLVDDDAAVTLIEYARVLALHGSSDTVTLAALGSDGMVVDATFLLTASTALMVESADSAIEPPDNTIVTNEMIERIRVLTAPNRGVPETDWDEQRGSDRLE